MRSSEGSQLTDTTP